MTTADTSFSSFRNCFFPIRHSSPATNYSLCQKVLDMKNWVAIVLVLIGMNALAQTGTTGNNKDRNTEAGTGTISGQVITTDGLPASLVTILIKENHKAIITDEQGNFTLKAVGAGAYTIEISMIGLKAQDKRVEVKAGHTTSVLITLSEDEKKLNEVVVTSGRRLNNKSVSIGKIDINPMDLPQSLTVVGQSVIRDQQAQRLSDVVKNVNGVYLTTTRGNVQESFAARGYAFGSSNLFKNGSRINSGVMPEMSSLEKVEVLKGSAAILFGQVAPGGVLNMVTKQPKFNSGGEVSMRVGSYDLYKPSFDVYGPVSRSIAYRLNGTYETAGSFRDQVQSMRYYVNPSLLFRLGQRTELVAEGDYLYHQFTPDFGIGSLDNTKIPAVPRSRFMGTPWQYNNTQQGTASVTVKYAFSEHWKLNTSASYQSYKRDYYGVERIQAVANGDWTRPLGKTLASENYYTAQTNLNGNFKTSGIEHTLLFGLDADHYLTTNTDFSFPAVAGLPAGSYDKINILDPGKYAQRTDIAFATAIRKREAPVNRLGAYGQDLLKLSSKFNMLAGVRWSYVETKGIDSTSLLTEAKTMGKNRYDNALSPRLGLVYKPATTTSLFASYSNSFVVNSGQDIEGNAVKPSLIDQYEVGVKNEFFNGILSANVTAYRIVNNNLAQTAPFLKDGTPNNNTGIKQLTGQTTSDGLEIDIATHPLKGLDITAGYSFNYMRYTRTDTTVGSFKTGERLVNNPAHTANATAFYNIADGLLKGLKLGATVVYLGERFGGWNTDVIATNPVKYRTRLMKVNRYTTIDVSAGYPFKKVSVMAKVSNLTNTLNYYVHENYSINPIPPTQLIATVAYRF
jgi:iron complex outermembrane recepter protein